MARVRILEERFWASVRKSDGCWEWTGSLTSHGYGRLSIGGRDFREVFRAHRLSYEFANGPIPDGLFIDHICHNRACVRPDHLRLATPKQNSENLGCLGPNNTSGARGVSWDGKNLKWRAQVGHNGQIHHLGRYESPEEAAEASRKMRLELFTHNDLDRLEAAA